MVQSCVSGPGERAGPLVQACGLLEPFRRPFGVAQGGGEPAERPGNGPEGDLGRSHRDPVREGLQPFVQRGGAVAVTQERAGVGEERRGEEPLLVVWDGREVVGRERVEGRAWDGQIAVQGFAAPGEPFELAITGGTGRYRAVRGQVIGKNTSPTEMDITLVLR